MDYSQAQEDEILVLESIYADAITRLPPSSSSSNGKGTTLLIKLDINLPFSSRFSCYNPETSVSIPITTPTLPPLNVHVFLPLAYPGKTAPICERICTWVPTDPNGQHSSDEKGEGCYLPSITVHSISRKLRDLWVENGSIEPSTMTGDEEADVGDVGTGEGVLWGWLDWLGSGAFLDEHLGETAETETKVNRITKTMDGVYLIPSEAPQTVHSLLREHLQSTLVASFNTTLFPCGICFDTKKGRQCVSLPCALGCVFCMECLNECWSLAIKEGTVDGVACPGWECVKARAKASQVVVAAGAGAQAEQGGETQVDGCVEGTECRGDEIQMELVAEVVGRELAERYKWLREKKRVENDPTYTMCPLQHCQSPVPPPRAAAASTCAPPTTIKTARIFRLNQPSHALTAETEKAAQEAILAAEKRRVQAEEDLADRFRQCPTCQFSFCRFCNKTWHGTSPCPLPATASFLTSYMATPEDSPAREAYEKRYGKKQLTRMVKEWVEQRANADWFDKHTRACAGCGTRVNKSAGCNHMICSKCAAHFCYRCGTKLRPADPYHHYRTPGSQCFEKLFDADEIARFEREIVADPAALDGVGGGFEDEFAAFGMGVEVDGWVGDVFPLQGNGGWW